MAKILVISHSNDEGRSLAQLLRQDGHRPYRVKTDLAAQRVLAAERPELIVLSLPDPSSSMRQLARVLGSSIRSTPAIAVVHEHERGEVERDVPGLLDFLATPFSDASFLGHIDALLRVRRVLIGGSEMRSGAAAATESAPPAGARGALHRVLEFLREARPGRAVCSVKPLEPYLETATALVGTVEGRDSIDTGHAVRVGTHCASIADFLGLGAEETQALLYAASVHDIGKIGITPELLAKPSLSEADRKVMKFHPRRGAELIRALTPYAEAADVVHYHHERPDGTGYYGRTPDQVPALARVLAVADVFDGMTFSRHGTTLGAEEAVERLREGSGKSYDADCVEALASAVRPARVSIPVSAQPTLFRS